MKNLKKSPHKILYVGIDGAEISDKSSTDDGGNVNLKEIDVKKMSNLADVYPIIYKFIDRKSVV